MLVPGLVQMALAFALWKVKVWAWWLNVLTQILLAALIFRVRQTEDDAFGGPFLPIIVVLLVIVACLLTPQARRAFWPQRQSRVRRIRAK
jgi:hypothetical protein